MKIELEGFEGLEGFHSSFYDNRILDVQHLI